MCEAAAQRNEEINNVGKNPLQLHHRTDSEPDIDLAKDTGKTNDDLEVIGYEHLQQSLRNIFSQKAYKYQLVGVRCSIR